MNKLYDVNINPPPKDREIIVQVVNANDGEKTWHTCIFDDSADGHELDVVDADDNLVGRIVAWMDIKEFA